MQAISRRFFLKKSSLSVAGAGLLGVSRSSAIEPFKRAGSPNMALSLAAYSFRDYFKDANHKRDAATDPAKRIDLFQFIDYCVEQGCQGTELTSYYFPADFDVGFLLKLKRHAFLRGIAISGTAVGNTFTAPAGPKRDQEIAGVKRWIDHASIMGAPHIRIFAGEAPTATSRDQAKTLCISAIEECCEHAGTKGIFLGLENHGGIVAEPEQVLEIVRAVKSPWFGVNLDTGNFHTDDIYGDLAKCAPYAVNVQVKTEISRRGQKKEPADLPRVLKILRDANYQGYLALEYEAAEDPWKAVPEALKRLKQLLAG
jgi:sugar phosphate isomerase/epimerase